MALALLRRKLIRALSAFADNDEQWGAANRNDVLRHRCRPRPLLPFAAISAANRLPGRQEMSYAFAGAERGDVIAKGDR
jgi:hypothetical protein